MRPSRKARFLAWIGSWLTESGLPVVAMWKRIVDPCWLPVIDAAYPLIAATQGTMRALAALGAESTGARSPNAVMSPSAGTPVVAFA